MELGWGWADIPSVSLGGRRTMRDLLDTQYFRVVIDRDQALVYVTRKSALFKSVIDCDHAYADVVRTMNALNRGKLRVLINLIDAPPTNDPMYERIINVYRKKVYAGFIRSAVVVRTAAGVLQVSRHARDDKQGLAVFQSEAEAKRYLLDEAGPPP
jgi:hypothetical protein